MKGEQKQGREKIGTHTFLPSFPSIRIAALVFLRIFFFPSGVNVEVHVLHGISSGPAVRHSMWGKLDEVPVPRKMNSSGLTPLIEVCKALEVLEAMNRMWGSGWGMG